MDRWELRVTFEADEGRHATALLTMLTRVIDRSPLIRHASIAMRRSPPVVAHVEGEWPRKKTT